MIVQHQTICNSLTFLYLKSNLCVFHIDYKLSLAQKLFAGNKKNRATNSKCCVIPVLLTRGDAHV